MKPSLQFLVALSGAMSLLSYHLKVYITPANRFQAMWTSTSAYGLFLAILLLACLLWVSYRLVRKSRMRHLVQACFVGAVTFSLLRTLLLTSPWADQLPRGLLSVSISGLAFGAALVFQRWRLPQKFANVCLMFSPLFLVLAFQYLTATTFPIRHTEYRPSFEAKEAHPIFILIFDAWAWNLSVDEEGGLRDLFPHLRAFQQNSFTFEKAFSAGVRTDYSIPAFLLQTKEPLIYSERGYHIQATDGSYTHASQHPSLFTLAKSHDYNTSISGFFVNYPAIFPGQFDHTQIFNHDPQGETIAQQVAMIYRGYINTVLDILRDKNLFSKELHGVGGARAEFSEHWRDITYGLNDELRLVSTFANDNLLAVVHLPVPHPPFIFAGDGAYLGPFPRDRLTYDPLGYDQHLAFLDLTVGRFVEGLKADGRYDNATIIITSDHTWKDQPHIVKATDPMVTRHIPLFIKLPGQIDGKVIRESFSLTDLKPILNAVMQGDVTEARTRLLAVPNQPE